MAEIAPGDLPAELVTRLGGSTAAQTAIDAALVAARRYCGWHVSPVRVDDVFELDGPGGQVLSLPTLSLNSVTSVTELGVAVDVTTLDRSRRRGTLTKPFGCWTARDGAIVAVVTHGFTEAEAADWRKAVIRLVDERSEVSIRDDADMKRKKIDDTEYEWFGALLSVDQELAGKFAQFRILPAP
ncbi:uncharacterized protein RMCC_2433 [Mycolicibacterium canariasense]|uniref:Head-to-tail adaptor n=1 Tax=Mycolicibacterium canariasense TaxID=228230 RepID=A0A100WBK5_MYCCR|nr:hypothetical protein [Mycolicibacterium canariasense]MCV7212660.1 hypothetical protein [Mycolicibacterium canariasense]ORV02505.1 hypothetical protein AWB94_00770 [Mycolicibacterium canariasense]GAS95467.1 uncharacterized protein RMCC_2433 [Mycolicibacterium canariasense]